MSRILVVDDKEMMRDSVATLLGRRGHTVIAVSSGAQAIEKIAAKRPDAVLTDLQMPEMNGVELLAKIIAHDETIPVVLMTAYGTVQNAVEAMRSGAYDYVTKPFSGEELEIAVERAIDHAKVVRENQVLKAAATRGGPSSAGTTMIGSGALMSELGERLPLLADSQGTVMIDGESGTGKEVAARLIHELSPRAKAPFLAVNCAALSASLLESELFGHEKGAFTGADKTRKGRFEIADGGTLLLDEVSEMPIALQSKLLRVLQERAFERVGSSQTRKVDVRIIATTNRNLQKSIDAGEFRGDLFFRLNVLPVTMPPLRERLEDVESLAEYFLGQLAAREGKTARRFDADAIACLRRYAWPGNVRELQNICERAAVLSQTDCIEATLIRPWLEGAAQQATARARDAFARLEPRDLDDHSAPQSTMQSSTPTANGGAVSLPPSPSDVAAANEEAVEVAIAGEHIEQVRGFMACDGRIQLEDIEREAILATLAANRGHRQKSAQALGIGVRTLGMKLKHWKELSLIPAET